jgi:GNAT superfamily N-acetyltransferase
MTIETNDDLRTFTEEFRFESEPTKPHYPAAEEAARWPLFRHSDDLRAPVARVAAPIALFLAGEQPRGVEIHLAGKSLPFRDLESFISRNRFDYLAEYDVYHDLYHFESGTEISEVMVAVLGRARKNPLGWAAIRRDFEISGEIAGYRVILSNIFIAPDVRGYGIATLILGHALTVIAEDLNRLPGGLKVQPIFHAACVSMGGEATANSFAKMLQDLVEARRSFSRDLLPLEIEIE